MGSSRPSQPVPTPEELALEKRTEIGLRRERAKTERMLKSQARGKLGARSLISGIGVKPKGQESVQHTTRQTEGQDLLNAYLRAFKKGEVQTLAEFQERQKGS